MKWIYEHKQFSIIVSIFLICMLGVCFLLYQPITSILQNNTQVKIWVEQYPLLGRIGITLVMCLQVIFIFLPGEIVEVVSGLLYGPIEGMLYCMLGVCIGSFLIFTFVKKFGTSFICMCTGKKEMEDIAFLQDFSNYTLFLFLIFLIPGTPKDMLTYCYYLWS